MLLPDPAQSNGSRMALTSRVTAVTLMSIWEPAGLRPPSRPGRAIRHRVPAHKRRMTPHRLATLTGAMLSRNPSWM